MTSGVGQNPAFVDDVRTNRLIEEVAAAERSMLRSPSTTESHTAFASEDNDMFVATWITPEHP